MRAILRHLLSLPFAAWTTPATWNTNDVVSASQLNAQLRDNMAFLLSGKQVAQSVYVGAADVTVTSTSFVDTDGTNHKLTLSNVTSGRVRVVFGINFHATADLWVDIIADGVTRAGHATYGLAGYAGSSRDPQTIEAIFTGLSAGSHTFKLQARVSTGTGYIYNNNWPVFMLAQEL